MPTPDLPWSPGAGPSRLVSALPFRPEPLEDPRATHRVPLAVYDRRLSAVRAWCRALVLVVALPAAQVTTFVERARGVRVVGVVPVPLARSAYRRGRRARARVGGWRGRQAAALLVF